MEIWTAAAVNTDKVISRNNNGRLKTPNLCSKARQCVDDVQSDVKADNEEQSTSRPMWMCLYVKSDVLFYLVKNIMM